MVQAADVTGPLKGVRVLEFSQIIAGPVAGIHLSDLGADVVKVEPPGGEARRSTGAVIPNEGKYFQTLNRGKRSLVVDLQRPAGPELIQRLVPGFDIVTINFRHGVATRLGIDYETLSRFRPDLIYVNITGFGDHGPEAMRGGSDVAAQAYSGLMAGEGKTDEFGAPASISASPFTDRGSALVAAMGVCAALYHRERTGEGQLVNVSLLQTALDFLARRVAREPVHDETIDGPLTKRLEEMQHAGEPYKKIVEERLAQLRQSATQRLYYGGYNAKDGAIVIGAVTRANRDAARRLLGVEDEPSDQPDFDARDPEAVQRSQGYRDRITETMHSRTVSEWVADFDAAGVPVSAVHMPELMADDPQVEAMQMMAKLEHEVTGPQRLVGPILRMSKTPPVALLPAPSLGRHTDEVLREGGLSDGEIASLRDSGTVA